MVQVEFRSSENDIQSYEDLIVKIPSQVNDYARDLYSGSPFKYKMAGDPEISASPVRPNLAVQCDSWILCRYHALFDLCFWI